MGVVQPDEPYECRVCGRRFYSNEKFLNHHFKQIHECEHMKRLSLHEEEKGEFGGEVCCEDGEVLDQDSFRQSLNAADVALRNHMVDMMDRRMVECLFLVSDDSDFVRAFKEAKMRCLKTVVVGDINEGALKRTADDATFSWQGIMIGKAKSEAVSVVKKWKDQNVLQKLEWMYDPENEKRLYFDEIESEDSDILILNS